MKKLIILSLLFIGCSKANEDFCNCEKITYKSEVSIITNANGLPTLTNNKKELNRETVVCQEEQEGASLGNDVYFNINCDG